MSSTDIASFVGAINKVLGTMVKTQVRFEDPFIKKAEDASHDVSGIIGFTGAITGSIVLGFPLDVAATLTTRFAGIELTPDHEDFTDAVGELVNMIAGAAKTAMQGGNVSISCPSVVIGHDHQVYQRKNLQIIVIPCISDAGRFVVELSLRRETASGAPDAEIKRAG